MTTEIQYRCPACRAVATVPGWIERGGEALECSACGHRSPIPGRAELGAERMLRRCPVCGGDEFYLQRDFNRRLGLALVVLGILLAWPTRGVSLAVVAVFDLALYFLLPGITICYRCDAIFRGLTRNPAHGGFELATHDKYRAIRACEAEARGGAGGGGAGGGGRARE